MKNWKKLGEVTLHDVVKKNEGVYPSLTNFLKSWKYQYEIRGNLTDNPGHAHYLGWDRFCVSPRYWLTDELGLVIPLWRIEEEYKNLPTVVHHRFSRSGAKRRDGFSCYYRKPKTRNERSRNSLDVRDEDMLEYNIRIRRKRMGYNLPSDRDDVQRGDIRTRYNWKNWRKKQYK